MVKSQDVEGGRVLPEGVEREPTADEFVLLSRFITLCLQYDIPFTISFDTGRYVPGEHTVKDGKLIHPDDIPREHVVQGNQGFTIEVNMNRLMEDPHTERLFPSLGETATGGLNMLFYALAEVLGSEEAAKKAFARYFIVETDEQR